MYLTLSLIGGAIMEEGKFLIDLQKYVSSTHVPDKAYAFSTQLKHALYLLMHCGPGDVVSVEELDDLSIKRADGSVEVIQFKTVSSDSNPIADRAVDLWKTFYNWLIAVKTGELNCESTTFKLFVAARRTGTIIKQFNDASSIQDATKAWREVKKTFFDNLGNDTGLAKSYEKYVREFFDNANEEIACGIIRKFQLETIEGNYSDMLYNNFCTRIPIPEELYEHAYYGILGWLKETLAKQKEIREAMCIPFDTYKKQLSAIVRELNQKQSLIELAPKPTTEKIESEYNAVRVYIQQLDIINCDYDTKIEAVSDYLWASANRTAWGIEGYVSEKSFRNFDDELIRIWENQRRIVWLEHKGLSQEEQGQLLYFKCKEKDIRVAHLHVNSFFISGSYHALADELKVGWHPQYKSKLRRDTNESA